MVQRTFKQNRKVFLILLLCLILFSAGMIISYNNTRMLGFGDTTPIFSMRINAQGEIVLSIAQKQWILNGIVTQMYHNVFIPIKLFFIYLEGKLEQLMDRLPQFFDNAKKYFGEGLPRILP